MGTRADFYVVSGKEAEWIGSIAWDGYEWAEDKESALAKASTEAEFREEVRTILAGRDDATFPKMGWPWPWNDSGTTDYAYYFKDGAVHWDDRENWPDMSALKKTTFGKRSGIMVVGR